MGDSAKTTEGNAFILSFEPQVVAKHGLAETRYSVVRQWLDINSSSMRVELKALLRGRDGEWVVIVNDCVYEADMTDDDKVAKVLEMTGYSEDDIESIIDKMRQCGLIAHDYVFAPPTAVNG